MADEETAQYIKRIAEIFKKARERKEKKEAKIASQSNTSFSNVSSNALNFAQNVSNIFTPPSNNNFSQTSTFKPNKPKPGGQFRDNSKTYLFQDVAKDAKKLKMSPRTQEGRDWFRDRAKEIRSMKPQDIFNKRQNWIDEMSRYMYGRMLFFEYSDPKWKKELPYYDVYPLIFPFWQDSKYFMGLNMHYLHPVLRAKLMDALYSTLNNTRFDDRTKLNLSYGTLKGASSLKYYKPCIKKYLKNRVKSVFVYIPPREWDYVLQLPLARFKKQSQETVWKDSERIANK